MPNADFRPQGPLPVIDRIVTTNDTLTPIQTFPFPDAGTYRLEIEVIAEATSGASACFSRRARVKNYDGQISVKTFQADWTTRDVKAWEVFIEPFGLNVQILVQGDNGSNIAWTVTSTSFVQL